MYSDVKALWDILEYLITHSLFFRAFVIIQFILLVKMLYKNYSFSFKLRNKKEDKKDEV